MKRKSLVVDAVLSSLIFLTGCPGREQQIKALEEFKNQVRKDLQTMAIGAVQQKSCETLCEQLKAYVAEKLK